MFYQGELVATETYQVQLERVQETIAAIEGGSREVRRGERTYTDADLPTLYAREARLRKYVDRASGSKGPRQVVPG